MFPLLEDHRFFKPTGGSPRRQVGILFHECLQPQRAVLVLEGSDNFRSVFGVYGDLSMFFLRYIGDDKLPSYVGNVKSLYKDPYQTTSIILESI